MPGRVGNEAARAGREMKAPYPVGKYLWVIVKSLWVAASGFAALVSAGFAGLFFASGSYCEGDPDPLFPCYPTFGEDPLAYLVPGALGLALLVGLTSPVWAPWSARRSIRRLDRRSAGGGGAM